MFCQKCGFDMGEDNYCQKCGTAINAAAQSGQSEQSGQPAMGFTPYSPAVPLKKQSNSTLLVLGIAMLVFFLLHIIFYVVLRNILSRNNFLDIFSLVFNTLLLCVIAIMALKNTLQKENKIKNKEIIIVLGVLLFSCFAYRIYGTTKNTLNYIRIMRYYNTVITYQLINSLTYILFNITICVSAFVALFKSADVQANDNSIENKTFDRSEKVFLKVLSITLLILLSLTVINCIIDISSNIRNATGFNNDPNQTIINPRYFIFSALTSFFALCLNVTISITVLLAFKNLIKQGAGKA